MHFENGTLAFCATFCYFLLTLGQGSPNYGPRAKSGPRRHFANKEKQYNKEKFVDLAECNIS